MADVTYRIGRPGDDVAYYGFAVPWPWAGMVALVDGMVKGIGGVAWKDDGRAWAFLDCPRELMPRPITAQRMALAVLKSVFSAAEPAVFVIPAPRVSTAKRWLVSLGFAYDGWSENDVEVWACRG